MKDVQTMLERLDPSPALRTIEPNNLDLGPKEDAFDFVAQCRTAGMDPRQAVLDVLAKAKRIDLLTGYRARQEAIVRGELRAVPLPWPELTRLTRALQPGRSRPDGRAPRWRRSRSWAFRPSCSRCRFPASCRSGAGSPSRS